MAGRERAVRSDSLRNRDAILDAAEECLTANPNSTLADIAAAASIARITLYGHFASRNDLLMALLHRSMSRVEDELARVNLAGDPWDVLDELVTSSWKLVNSLAVLRGVVEEALPAEAMHGSHADPRTRVEHLLARGRAEGAFRVDQGIAWQTACYFALLHGAAAELRAGRLTEQEVEANLLVTFRALLRASPGS